MKIIIMASFFSTVSMALAMTLIVLMSMISSSDFSYNGFVAAGIIIAAAAAVGLILVLLIGIPLHLFMGHNNYTSVVPYALLGFFSAFSLIFLAKPISYNYIVQILQHGTIVGAIGLIGSLVFWHVAVKR